MAKQRSSLGRIHYQAELGSEKHDRRSAWDMQPDGSYVQRRPANEKDRRGAHEQLIAIYEDRHRHATLGLKKRSKERSRRNF